MMKIGTTIVTVLVVGCISYACTYSEDDIYRVDPLPGDPPVVLATTNLDTINDLIAADSLEVAYEISIQNGELYFLDAWVGNNVVHESDTTSGSFWIYSLDAEIPGIDTLRLMIYYSSNTNSLADLFGIEALNLELKYAIDFTRNIK